MTVFLPPIATRRDRTLRSRMARGVVPTVSTQPTHMISHRWRILLSWGALSLICLAGGPWTARAQDEANLIIAPDDPKIAYSDYVHLEFVPSPLDPSAKLARFDRVLDIPSKG
ncbi:MAG: hypothetical protein ABI624_19960, partial [Casimicrobiaceae bacterium]